MIGSDPAALRQMAQQFDTAAGEFESCRTRVNNIVTVAAWRGQDSDRFRQDWNSTSSALLSQVARELRAAAKSLRANADEQDRTSGADSSWSSSQSHSTQSQNGPRTASTVGGLVDQHDHGNDNNHDGIRIQTIIDSNGDERYIVYLGGTQADPARGLNPFELDNWYENVGVVTNVPTPTTVYNRILMEGIPKDANILIVGYSQGGGQGEYLAEHDYPNAIVINEHGPRVPGGDGANVIRINGDDAFDSGVVQYFSGVTNLVPGALHGDPSGQSDGVNLFDQSDANYFFDPGKGHGDHAAASRALEDWYARTPDDDPMKQRLAGYLNGRITADSDNI